MAAESGDWANKSGSADEKRERSSAVSAAQSNTVSHAFLLAHAEGPQTRGVFEIAT